MRLPGLSGRVARSKSASGRIGVVSESPLIGCTFLRRYTVVRPLGEGSNADVYLATCVDRPDYRVVVKRVKDHVAKSPRFKQFFDAEVRSMSRFEHPFAVKLLDASMDDPLGACLIMDFIPGITLEQLLRREGHLPYERVARLLGPLCHALQAAHSAGIVHRDLKPANLMVVDVDTPQESVRVMDFGFAGFTEKPHIQLAQLTGVGPIFACGTPAYVSPEMIRGDSVDNRGDLYSVGVILFEMLTGQIPFEDEETQQDLLLAHLEKSPPKFRNLGFKGIPPAMEAAVQIALSKYPSERHVHARDLMEQFSRPLEGDTWTQTAPQGYDESRAAEVDLVEFQTAEEPSDPSLDKYILSDQFEAMMPERLAVVKLRGFIEDMRAKPVESEPGLIRVRIDMPQGWKEPNERAQSTSAILGWLSNNRAPTVESGREPIEVELRMAKLDPNRVTVIVAFRPLKQYLPTDLRQWSGRCESVYSVLRNYLMAE